MVRDPGPMARLEMVKADSEAPGEIFRRLCEGEKLPAIGKAMGLPKGRFVEWFTTEHIGLYDLALKVRAADLAMDALDAADGATPETVQVAKLKADVYLRLAAKFDRERFGDKKDMAVAVTTVPDAGLVGTLADLIARAKNNTLKEVRGEVIEVAPPLAATPI